MWGGKYPMIICGYSDTPQKMCTLLRMNGIRYEFIDDDIVESFGFMVYENSVHIGIIPTEKWHYVFLEQLSKAMRKHGGDVNHTLFFCRTRNYINGK